MVNISKFLSIMKDGIMKNKLFVVVPLNNFLLNVLWILYQYGYICGFQLINNNYIKIQLKYNNGKSSIQLVKQISSIAKRIYIKHNNLQKNISLGTVFFISTSSGIKLSFKDVFKKAKGGEVLFKIN